MMRTRLKVCCISSIDEARLAVSHGASALGLVAAMPTGPGVIDDVQIATIARTVPPPVSRFLLTSRTAAGAIASHVRACHVDTVQLVDAVPSSEYAILRDALPHVRIVQVLHVEDEEVLRETERVASHVDAILLDSGRPKLRELGGTGRVHDWSLSKRVVESTDRPVFLAGGLSAANAARAIEEVRPYGLDVCSGVRTNGALDGEKLAALVAAMR